jgi:hypothetical protein
MPVLSGRLACPGDRVRDVCFGDAECLQLAPYGTGRPDPGGGQDETTLFDLDLEIRAGGVHPERFQDAFSGA